MPTVSSQHSRIVNASKAFYRFVRDASTGPTNVRCSFAWKRGNHDGLVLMHQEHIIRTFIFTLFQTHAIPSGDGGDYSVLDIPFLPNMNIMDLSIVHIPTIAERAPTTAGST